MIDMTLYGSLIELMIQVAVVVVVAAIIGFWIGRWFYRSEARVQLNILQQEIMRLRRRVADADRSLENSRRTIDRSRRQSKRIPELDGFGI